MKNRLLNYFNSKYSFLSLFLIFSIILILNILTPMWNDEYSFSFSILNENERISSIKDIIKSQIAFYQKFSGRVFLHAIIQFFCWVGKDFFNIINTIIFILLPLVITRFYTSNNLQFGLIFTTIIWFFSPVPGETIFWLSGSVNYLWPTLMLLVYIHLLINNRTLKVLLPLGFIVGALHEVVFVCVFIFSTIFIILEFFRIRKIDKKKLILLSLNILGGIFLFIAPGNLNRKEIMYGIVESSQSFHYFKLYYLGFLNNIFPLLLCLVLLWILKIIKQKGTTTKNTSLQISLIATSLLTPLSLFFSPEAAERTLFAPITLLITALAVSISSFKEIITNKESNLKFKLISLLFTVGFLISSISELPKFISVFFENSNNTSKIQKGKRENKETIELEPISTNSKYIFVFNPKFDASYIVNKNISKYFEVNSVRLSGDYMKIVLDKPVATGYTLSYKIKVVGKINQINSSAFIYNNFDGNSVFFPFCSSFNEVYTIQFGDIPEKEFTIKSINIINNSSIEIKDSTLYNSIVEKKLVEFRNERIYFKTNKKNYCLSFKISKDKLNNEIPK
jgi:hypothetical protein